MPSPVKTGHLHQTWVLDSVKQASGSRSSRRERTVSHKKYLPLLLLLLLLLPLLLLLLLPPPSKISPRLELYRPGAPSDLVAADDDSPNRAKATVAAQPRVDEHLGGVTLKMRCLDSASQVGKRLKSAADTEGVGKSCATC